MKNIALLVLALLALTAAAAADTLAEPTPAAVAKASDEGIFKYTITTDIDTDRDQLEILVAMNSVGGQYPVKYDLDCEGDGEFEYQGLTDNKKCIYKKNSGTHQIWVRGEIPGMFLCARNPGCPFDKPCNHGRHNAPFRSFNEYSKNAVISIDSWGNLPWKSMHLFAADCEALNKLPEGSPDLRQVKDMSGMFWGAKSFNQPLDAWDVSNVTDMSDMFSLTASFNQPLEKWNVSNVANMSRMFFFAKSFNQPLGYWDVSNVTDMSDMFGGAKSFNQSLDAWDVSSVTRCRGMFTGDDALRHYPQNLIYPQFTCIQ